MWEDLAVGDVLAHLRMQALDGIGGVNDAAQLDRIFEEGGQIGPVVALGCNRCGIASFPGLCKAVQCELSSLDGRRHVDRAHAGAQRFAVFPGNELGHVADVVHDAQLDVGLGEEGFHGIAQPAKPSPHTMVWKGLSHTFVIHIRNSGQFPIQIRNQRHHAKVGDSEDARASSEHTRRLAGRQAYEISSAIKVASGSSASQPSPEERCE